MNAYGEKQKFFNWNYGEPKNNQDNKQDVVKMLLSDKKSPSGNDNQGGKWNDMNETYHVSNRPSTQNRFNFSTFSNNNMVVCTYVVPGTGPSR